MNDLIKRERDRIARELHDRLGQTLTSLKLDMAWIKRRLVDGAAPTALIDQRLEEMMHSIDASVDEVRAISHALRLPEIHPEELPDVIESHVRAIGERLDLKVFCDLDRNLPLSSEQATQIYLIVRECLTNIARHAQAGAVWLSMESSRSSIDLRIRDDGRGIHSAARAGQRDALGLNGMTERATTLGATLRVAPWPRGGTLVHLHLPLPGAGPAGVQSISQPHRSQK